MGYRIGFISTRFSGADGVTLEAGKWSEVLEKNGNTCFWFAGELDKSAARSCLVPEAHFKDEHNQWVNDRVFGQTRRSPAVTERIHASRSFLKARLHAFIDKFNLDILVAENVLTIPMQIPLGLALSEAIAETGLPTIAHHHDFFWERSRYTVNAVGDYLQTAFPLQHPRLHHVVINSEAQKQLALRTGTAATVIPNVLDFAHPPKVDKAGGQVFRQALGLAPEDKIILQPTRVVQRKGIEHAIELVRALADPRFKLVITHEAGDEGYAYVEWLESQARDCGVDLRLAPVSLEDPWADSGSGERAAENGYTLWDIYDQADLVTYPSLYEGFGNAFLEAVYLKKPILINRYETFIRDIEPLGFKLATMDGFLAKSTVQHVRTLLASPELCADMAAHNYKVAADNFSYHILEERLGVVMRNATGDTAYGKPGLEPDQPNIVYLNRGAGFQAHSLDGRRHRRSISTI
ncbi:MAG: glycosyltransferase family 4 protein [Thermodesulfobacteriota bacterium]